MTEALASMREHLERCREISADLLAACEAQEAADDAHTDCPECQGLDAPEICDRCFPAADDARCKRRAAIAKARGEGR